LIAWRRLSDVPDEPVPWLFAVARKVIAGQLRSHSRREALRARLEVTTVEGAVAGEVGEDVVERTLVLTAFAGLSQNDREVLMLVAWDGLSSKSAAGVLGVTRFAFGMRLQRARRRLSAALAAAERAGRPSWGSGPALPRHGEQQPRGRRHPSSPAGELLSPVPDSRQLTSPREVR
ncbi:MAG TPA: sigma factor-like helix-turn-helix DNA-binding protein, partial [Streptosporangiaceae bacterium]|nr:sigma factor-like helix-turn-helix DNA-binding protein [Streptosporangiaceae bacterium]